MFGSITYYKNDLLFYLIGLPKKKKKKKKKKNIKIYEMLNFIKY